MGRADTPPNHGKRTDKSASAPALMISIVRSTGILLPCLVIATLISPGGAGQAATAWKQAADVLNLTRNVLPSVIDDGFARAGPSFPIPCVTPKEISRG